MPNSQILSPAGFVPSRAVAFANVDGSAMVVSASNPLPVTTLSSASVTPLAGSATASVVLGPFQPIAGRAVILALSGTWTGTAKVTRSTDGGTTRLPLSVAGSAWAQFSGNCCEAVWEEADAAARLYLDVTLSSGALTYRMGQ